MSNLTISRPPQFLDPWFVEIEQVWDEIETSVNDNDSRISTLETAIISDVVTSISKSGDPQLTGDVTLSPGGTIILTQVGNNITISGGGVTDHGALTGLADDDHLLYIKHDGTRAFTGNQSFGNFQALNFRVQNLMIIPAAGNQGRLIFDVPSLSLKVDNGTSFVDVGITDHGLLTGLGDDDHLIYLLANGLRPVTGDFTVNGKYLNEDLEPMILESQEADGGSAIAFILDTAYALNTAGAKLLSLRNNGVEKLFIDKDGNLIITVLASPTSAHVLIDTDNNSTSETFTVETNTPTPGGGTILLKIEEDGTITTIGDMIIASSAKIKSAGDLQFQVDFDNDGSNKFSWLDGLAAEVMSLTEDGDLDLLRHANIGGDLTIDGLLIGGASPFTIQSRETNGATTAFIFDTIDSFTDPAAKLAEIKNQGSTKFTLSKDGDVSSVRHIAASGITSSEVFKSIKVPVYDATLWGAADDNGVTDNSGPLSDIIDDILSSNNYQAIIYFPAGTGPANYYHFLTTVTKDLANYQILITGSPVGKGNVQNLVTTFRLDMPTGNGFEFSNGTVSLDSIVFVGGGNPPNQVTAIQLTNCGGGFIHNCLFSMNFINTLVMTSCNHWHFDLNTFGAGPDTTGKLLDLQQCNWIQIDNTYMSGYQPSPGGDIGFNLGFLCANISIDGLYAYNLPGGAIKIADLSRVVNCQNLYLFATVGRLGKGIIIDTASDVVIDNIFTNILDTYDIELYNRPLNVSIRNYRTEKSGYTGINDLTGITILGNSTDQPTKLPYVKGFVNRDEDLICGIGGTKAIGKLVFTGASLATETLTLNGVLHTYVSGITSNPNEIREGSTIALAATRTATYFNRNSSERDVIWAWSDGIDTVYFYAKDPGIAANAYTFSETLTNAAIPADTGFMNNHQVGVDPVDNFRVEPDGDTYIAGMLSLGSGMGFKSISTAVDILTAGEQFIGVTNTGAIRTITISSADIAKGSPTKAYPIFVKDESGGAGTNKITVATEGAELIDGQSEIDITADYGVLRLYSNGSNLFSL